MKTIRRLFGIGAGFALIFFSLIETHAQAPAPSPILQKIIEEASRPAWKNLKFKGPIPRQVEVRWPIPYLDNFLTPQERAGWDEKYRAIFTSNQVLQSIALLENGAFPQWNDAQKDKLFDMILFYETHPNRDALPPAPADCVFDDAAHPCYQMQNLPRQNVEFTADYTRYLQLTQIAWHLYVEANRLVPWSILNYSPESLNYLFGNTFNQPGLWHQFFVTDVNIVEDYRLMRGNLREAGDRAGDLVGPTALKTILNTALFLGERLTHFKGSSNNTMGPATANIWPYRMRDAQGNLLRDAQGNAVPLPRHPTPKEILIYRDPHKNPQDPQNLGGVDVYSSLGPQFHITNGCWGTSALLRALLSSVNIPVEMMGDYASWSGHSGVRFAEIEGNNYSIHHSDDLYLYEWIYGLLNRDNLLDGQEIWQNENFHPFEDRGWLSGYSVFHTNLNRNDVIRITPAELGLTPDLLQELYEGFSGYIDYDLRTLALRAATHPSSVQNLYTFCSENPYIDQRHIPVNYLTQWETDQFKTKLSLELLGRQIANPLTPNCFDLFFNSLNALSKKKTGLELRGDEDRDGIENYRDCNVYGPDRQPCEGAFQKWIGIGLNAT